MTRSNAEIREAAWWAIRVALARELHERPATALLGAPRAVPCTWLPEMQPRIEQRRPPAPCPVLQAAE